MDGALTPELIAEIHRTLPQQHNSCFVSILNDTGTGLVHRGTGTLFGVGSRFFIITAAHVVVKCKDEPAGPLQLYVCGPDGGAPLLLVASALLTHKTGGEDDDQIDVAAIELDQITREALGPCTFLRQVDVAPDDCPVDYYFVTGLPTAWANIDDEKGELTLLTYCTTPYDGQTSMFGRYDPDKHLLLRRGGGLKLSGEQAAMPPFLNGISGCNVWRSYYVNGTGAGHAKVVGVQTGMYRNQTVIKATRWSVVGELLYHFYDDLRPAMKLILPRRSA